MRRADMDQPAPGVVGHPFFRPLQGRREQSFLHRVLGGGEIAKPPDDRAKNLRGELAQQVLAGKLHGRRAHTSTGGALITSRTSMAMFSGAPPGPGAAGARPAIA